MAQCRQKHYPYPDGCVFLVTGHRIDASPLNFITTAPLIVVSRTAERASGYFLSMARDDQKWEVVGCVSLDQLKGLRDRMIQAAAGAATVKELKPGFMGAVLGHRQPWAVAFMRNDGQPTEPEIVMAMSSSDVKSYIESTGTKSTGMFSLDVLEEVIDSMKRTQEGKAKKERYAIDYEGGELAQELAEVRAKRTPEQQAKADEVMARVLRKQAAGLIQ